MAGLVASCAVLATTPALFSADTVYKKDGTAVEGKIQREETDFVVIVIKDASGKEQTLYLSRTDISRIERDGSLTNPSVVPPKQGTKPTEAPKVDPTKDPSKTEAPKPEPAKPVDGAKKDEPKARSTTSVARVAILNFGPPSDWQGSAGSMVGTVVNVKGWRDVIPLLEKDKVTDVVVRINSGGGLVAEMEPFNRLYEEQYKTRFRTVAWVESAISCAAMSPWVLEEFYFLPGGNIGACTAFGGPLIAVTGMGLEQIKIDMEKASRQGKRDPKIMLAMQIPVALSCNIDDTTGQVTWFQDESGSNIVNREGRILTLTANEAMKYKFGKGIAATKEELMKVMGYSEYEFAGKEAAKFIDENMKSNDTYEKRFQNFYQKYDMAVRAASQIQEKALRMPEVGLAKRHLEEMKKAIKVNPNIAMMNGVPTGWFKEQDELLKQLSR